VKLLLTSAGVKNPSIHEALLGLLGRPVEECDALAIPTAMYGHPWAGPGPNVWKFVAGKSSEPMTEIGWKSVGLLELTALPSISLDAWVPKVQEADVLLTSGGDALYLAHWMRQSGFMDLVPSLEQTVYMGMSAGSMALTPRIGEEFVGWRAPGGGDATLGLVDFSIFPHLEHPMLTQNTMAAAEKWAAELGNEAYAIDDDTAIVVSDGETRVVSEGQWRHFPG